MQILYWNAYIRHNKAHMVKELKAMAAKHQPAIIALGEAKPFYAVVATVPGYRRYAVAPGKGKGDENADTIVLVRNDIKVLNTKALRMRKRWKGPKAGIPHDPRVYRELKVRAYGKVWKVSAGHWPFGQARHETINWVKRWITHTIKGRPVIHVGDLNTKPAEVSRIARAIGAHSSGVGIDRAIFKNCVLVKVQNLGKHGSDHPAVLFTFK